VSGSERRVSQLKPSVRSGRRTLPADSARAANSSASSNQIGEGGAQSRVPLVVVGAAVPGRSVLKRTSRGPTVGFGRGMIGGRPTRCAEGTY
jgi:hypothetical protein